MLKNILQWKLRILSRMVLRRYAPRVIGITGSVGKTSTKDAIFTVLKSQHRVWKNAKNFNNEIGVPLAILGEERSGNANIFQWVGIFFRALRTACIRRAEYPEMLVIEMGADKTGDIAYLTEFVPCTVGVVTAVSGVHLEYFKTLDRVISEKRKMISHLSADGFAVLNADDEQVVAMREKTRAKVITYGFSDLADVRGIDPEIDEVVLENDSGWHVPGMRFKVSSQGSVVPVFLPTVLGRHQVYAGLAAAAVGLAFGMNLHEIAEALRTFVSPPGRMNLLPGIKYSRIIDDSYNSSPQAALAALDTLMQLHAPGRKIAVLGDMAELGDDSVRGHEDVGRYVTSKGVDLLVTVGEKAKIIAQAAREAGMPAERVLEFDHPEVAGRFIQKELRKGDLTLVKGSQVVRTEKIVKELMAEPLRAAELLVRQGEEWQ